jgi:hypothetical protein
MSYVKEKEYEKSLLRIVCIYASFECGKFPKKKITTFTESSPLKLRFLENFVTKKSTKFCVNCLNLMLSSFHALPYKP